MNCAWTEDTDSSCALSFEKQTKTKNKRVNKDAYEGHIFTLEQGIWAVKDFLKSNNNKKQLRYFWNAFHSTSSLF